MSVLKVIELMSDSDKSWEDAAALGIKRAGSTVKHIRSAFVQNHSVTVKNGQIDKYRVNLKIAFEVE